MPIVDTILINKLTQAGPRLPIIKAWLAESVWSEDRYKSMSALDYLHKGEAEVNDLERLIAATADRIYGEFLESDGKNFLRELSDAGTAIVVFDGMSIREMPILVLLAKKSGMQIAERDYAFSAIPSETMDFVGQRLNCPKIGPSQLPGRKELAEKGIKAVFLSSNTQALDVNSDDKALPVWSAFPDNT
jgi:hypothetical protein